MLPWEMLFAMQGGRCFPTLLTSVHIALGCVDGAIAAVAFVQEYPDDTNFVEQLVRIHIRNHQLGWTRQKVFHLMIGISNLGFFIYFVSTLVATCKGWFCWSHACAFVLMVFFPCSMSQHSLRSSISAAFIFLANDEEEEDEDSNFREGLLEKTQAKSGSSNRVSLRKCCCFQAIHVGSRQRFVIMVMALVFFFMMAFAVLIWIGRGKNRIDSSLVARVYIDAFSITMLLLGGALACYGLVLFMKMKKVRADKGSSEMWKVAGLAVVSVVCFTSSALVALFSDVPVLYHWHPKSIEGVETPVLISLYYFIGSSIPSAFVLWVMKELPPAQTVRRQAQPQIVTFIRDTTATMHHPQRWTKATSSQNQASRASPI